MEHTAQGFVAGSADLDVFSVFEQDKMLLAVTFYAADGRYVDQVGAVHAHKLSPGQALLKRFEGLFLQPASLAGDQIYIISLGLEVQQVGAGDDFKGVSGAYRYPIHGGYGGCFRCGGRFAGGLLPGFFRIFRAGATGIPQQENQRVQALQEDAQPKGIPVYGKLAGSQEDVHDGHLGSNVPDYPEDKLYVGGHPVPAHPVQETDGAPQSAGTQQGVVPDGRVNEGYPKSGKVRIKGCGRKDRSTVKDGVVFT